jgi:hypothetical protein
MSLIESAAKDPLVPILQGSPFTRDGSNGLFRLDASVQRSIAALLCLITMRVEFTHKPTMAASDEDRKWIRETRQPPPMWKVWIARYTGNEPGAHWCRHYGLQLVLSPDEIVSAQKCDTQTTTYVMGHLCAHVFSSTTIPTFDGYRGQGLCRLWPLTGWDIDCRALPTITDQAVLSLSEALAREIPAIPDTTERQKEASLGA